MQMIQSDDYCYGAATKAGSTTASKILLRYKLVVDNKIILQKMKLNYLRMQICGYGDQASRAIRVAVCRILTTIWRNEHINIETKYRIYKTVVGLIMT